MVESLRNDDKDDHQILKDKSTDGETSSRDSSYTASNVASSNISPADSLSRNTEYINGITIEPLPIDGGRKDSSLKGNEGAALRKRNTHRPRIDSDVLTRPTLCNARFALFLIKEVRQFLPIYQITKESLTDPGSQIRPNCCICPPQIF